MTSEDVRIHIDWYKQCRSCKFWGGDRKGIAFGPCSNKESLLFSDEEKYLFAPIMNCCTNSCGKWETYNAEAAEIAEKWDGKGESPDVIMKRSEK